jgi:hypothetical protein
LKAAPENLSVGLFAHVGEDCNSSGLIGQSREGE